jgi:hypothetical protein
MNLGDRMKARIKEFSQNEWVREQLPFLLLGMVASISLARATPLFPSVVFFLLSVVLLLCLVVYLALSKNFLSLRILFLGASVTSVLSAFLTFFSLVRLGLIQISLDDIVGIFRSVLLTSLFSLLERLTRFIEDQTRNKNERAHAK